MSHDISICQNRGLHSIRLLPHYTQLKEHLDVLEAMPSAAFAKPAHLPPLDESLDVIEEDVIRRRGKGPSWVDWRTKLRIGYARLTDTLWNVAREFNVRGYGHVLREKLIDKWCVCGCSTDHLGEVCERTVREEEEESGVRSGKEREWDGRGLCILSKACNCYSSIFYQGVVFMAGRLKTRRIYGRWTLTLLDLILMRAMDWIQI